MENRLEYFNLRNDGDSAIVRMLHTNTGTIESAKVHWVDVQGKKKNIKCCGENCPICSTNNQPLNRIFIHLIDYTDNNKEKVWSRTDKILSQLTDISNNWGGLNNCVLQIKRVGTSFPKYEINVVNPTQFPPIPSRDMVDKKIGYMFYMTRSAQEMMQFYSTGILPPHQRAEYIPKQEYVNQKNAQQNINYVNPNAAYGKTVVQPIPPQGQFIPNGVPPMPTGIPNSSYTVNYPPVQESVTQPYPNVTPYQQWANSPVQAQPVQSTPMRNVSNELNIPNAVPTVDYTAPAVNPNPVQQPVPTNDATSLPFTPVTDDFDDPFAPIKGRI